MNTPDGLLFSCLSERLSIVRGFLGWLYYRWRWRVLSGGAGIGRLEGDGQ